jgi:hypothetical protein
MKRIMVALMVAGFVMGLGMTVQANEEAAPAKVKVEKEKKEMAIKGKVSKEERKGKKEGAEAVIIYMVEAESGKMALPKGVEGEVDYEQYVGKDVTITAETEIAKTAKGDKVKILKIIEIKATE